MSDTTADLFDVNRPVPKATEIAWKQPPPPQNPVVKGLPLHYLSLLVSNVSFVQQVLWSNAGFGSLRDRPELESSEPRYEPTVIRTAGMQRSKNDEHYLRALLDESWDTKKPTSNVHYSVKDYTDAYKSGKVTPTDVAKVLIPLISREAETPTKHSTVFLQVRQDLVLKAAEESTQRYKQGRPISPLDGVPVAVKDEVDLSGYKKCYASKIDFTRKDDATSHCVKMWQDAGAVIMGKCTMQELGSDINGNNPNFGTPLNPYNEHYYCGGSSTGSAYTVGAGLMPLCEGNDGGGSIRIPSTYCGIYGLKTTHGRVSKAPSTDLARSTGVAGPMAANMIDLEIGYRIMAQPNPQDPDSAQFRTPGSISVSAGSNKVLGIYKPWFDQADAVVKESCQKMIDHLTSNLGYTIEDITIPLVPEGQLAHALTILTELVVGVKPSDTSKLTPANKVLLSVARKSTSVDFLQAQRLRNLIMQHLSHLYTKHPGLIIVTPSTAEAGWRIEPGDLAYGLSNSNKQLKNMTYAWLANFSGCPAISVPCGYADPPPSTKDSSKVPMGLCGMSDWCSEDALIAFGYDCERYLHDVLPGSRLKPGNWTDVLELAKARPKGGE